MENTLNIIEELRTRFGEGTITGQPTCDAIPTVWVPKDRVTDVLAYL